jgi:chromate reductase
MKTILCISGSASSNSSNTQLLHAMADWLRETYEMEVYEGLQNIPLFSPQLQEAGIPEIVQELRQKVTSADAIVISTPEYLHNIPAVLKNALEWMTESGELADKPVLPITFTPTAPRGEYAMKSLLQSLTAVKAKIVVELPLYRNEMAFENGNISFTQEQKSLLKEALGLL